MAKRLSEKIRRVAARIRMTAGLIAKGHIMNPFWQGKQARRRVRYKATTDTVMRYLQMYAPAVGAMKPKSKPSGSDEELVFTLWLQGEESAPPIVKACIRSMRRHLKQKLVVLDEKTLSDWISLPEDIVRKWTEGKMCTANFSDICRLELLYRYGGIWMDATDYMTAPIPEYVLNSDFFVFKTGEKYGKWFSFIESCFIRAKKGDPLLAVWRGAVLEYWRNENSAVDYFINLIMLRFVVENNETAAHEFARMPKVDHSQILDFWRYHGDDAYDASEFERMMSNSFMKKTSYHTRHATATKAGSMAEHLINS